MVQCADAREERWDDYNRVGRIGTVIGLVRSAGMNVTDIRCSAFMSMHGIVSRLLSWVYGTKVRNPKMWNSRLPTVSPIG